MAFERTRTFVPSSALRRVSSVAATAAAVAGISMARVVIKGNCITVRAAEETRSKRSYEINIFGHGAHLVLIPYLIGLIWNVP